MNERLTDFEREYLRLKIRNDKKLKKKKEKKDKASMSPTTIFDF